MVNSLAHREHWGLRTLLSSSSLCSVSEAVQDHVSWKICKYFANYLVLDHWHVLTSGTMAVHQSCFFSPQYSVWLHFPGTLEVSVAIRPGSSKWNVNRNDLSYLQAWPIKTPNCHLLCFLPNHRSWNPHMEDGEAPRCKEPEFLNYYLEQNQPLSRNTYLNFEWARSTSLFC